MRPAHSLRRPSNTGQLTAAWAPMESRWVRIALVPCAQLQRSPKSIRRRTSSADQWAVRSAATVRRAPANVPSGFGARSQVWPLSRWV